MTFDDAIDRYIAIKMGGLAESTWKAHRNELRRFARWVRRYVGADVDLADLDPDLLARYYDPRRPPVLSGSSFNNYRQYLVAFFDHCRDEGWIRLTPMRHVRPAKVRRLHRQQLRPAQVLAMMHAVSEPRDRFAIALGFNTALRSADVAALTVGAIDRRAGYVDVFVQKTQREMRLPLTADLDGELDQWLRIYCDATGGDGHGRVPDHWLLVPALRRYGYDALRPERGMLTEYRPLDRLGHPERIVQRGLAAINLPTFKEGFHTLRRASARHLYEVARTHGDSSPIRIVQSQLGHESQLTTEIYLGIRSDEVTRDEILRFRRFSV